MSDDYDTYVDEATWRMKTVQRAVERANHRERLKDRYGDLRRVLLLTKEEKALKRAVKPWAIMDPDRIFTCELRGPLPEIYAALKNALPWPKTIEDAKAEIRFWHQRNVDLAAVLDNDLATGDGDSIDFPASRRCDLIVHEFGGDGVGTV